MGLEKITYRGPVIAQLLGPAGVIIGQDTYRSDLTKTYVMLTLLNSFPKVNANGMTLLPPLLAKAAPTANDQPLNLDHQMEGNEPVYQGTSLVVGTMLKAYFAVQGDIDLLPEKSSPVKVVGVLWNRTAAARKIITSIGQGQKEYGVSFEIIRDLDEDGYVTMGEEGPKYHAEMSEEFRVAFAAREFDKVALAVGGDGTGDSTNIWGGGFTLIPADEDAGIDDVGVLTAGFNGECALAVKMPEAPKINKQEPTMDWKTILAKINSVLAQSGFSVQVAGGDKLTLDLAGNTIEQPDDFYLYAFKKSDGTYAVSASLTVSKSGIDGFKEQVRLEYEPNDDGNFAMTEVETADAKVKTPTEVQAQIDALNETIAGFAGFLSPDQVKAKVEEAVAAAKGDAPPKDPLTQEQIDEQISEGVQAGLDAQAAATAAAKSRGEALVAKSLILTPERETALATFAVGDDGDKAFNAWLTQLVASNRDMIKAVEKEGIEVTDSVKAAVAHIDSKNDSGFAALMASRKDATPVFTPSLAAAGDVGSEGQFAGVM